MNRRDAMVFLFTIAKETQHSFVNPVILLTHKDYYEDIFKTFVNIHQALLNNAEPAKIVSIINSFHSKWLEAVLEVERFRKRLKETPREVILRAIDFTVECTEKRFNYLQKYIDNMYCANDEEENQLMQSDIIIIKDMQEIVNRALLEKKQDIHCQTDKSEFLMRIHGEIEDLLHWLDKLNDNIAIEFCKIVNVKVPLAPSDLTKTLKDIIDEVAADPTPEAHRIAELIQIRGRMMGSRIRTSSVNELEIAKVVEKIKLLEHRISRLHTQNSCALMALKHKSVFLEERLQSLENIRMSMKQHKRDSGSCPDHFNEIRIFNHLLPHSDRCRLVEKLLQLWNCALTDPDRKSIISILSVAALNEIFTDEKGQFTVDEYGRKIYSKPNDTNLYQLNENNELVSVNDDEKHVYFYDSCGRYYINDKKLRVYKNHDGASEYAMSKCGYLVKILEKVDGVEYYYDWLGRYYIKDGRHIYCEENSEEEYEHDGLGNLVKIHEFPQYIMACPVEVEPMTMEENKYLKREVGSALKKCIAEVIAYQPDDPVAFLSDRLQKYHYNIKDRENRQKNQEERFELSQLVQPTKQNSIDSAYTAEEADCDYNFISYKHGIDDSVGSSF